MKDKHIQGHWDLMSSEERTTYLQERSRQLLIKRFSLVVIILILTAAGLITYKIHHVPEKSYLVEIEEIKKSKFDLCMIRCDSYFQTSVQDKASCISTCQK